jgi:probable phosphoglycerate mutase
MACARGRLARTIADVELVLVRHAQPEWVRDGFSVDDPPLTERGRRQAERLADRLAGEAFDDVFVSPLVRARQTAEPVLFALDRKEEVDDWLEEIRNPVWHGSPADKAEEVFREERARPVDQRWDGLIGGEPVRDFVARIRQGAGLFLEERGVLPLREDLPVWRIGEAGRRILLIAHAGVNSVVICHLLGLSPTPWEWDRFVLGHASVTRIEALPVADGYTWSLTRLSDVEHLAPEDRTR